MRAVTTWLIFGCLATPLHTASGRTPQTISEARGQAVYRTLASSGLLDNYMKDLLEEVLGRLMSVAQEWRGYQINAPHHDGYVNVYLIDAKRLPAPRLQVPGIKDIFLTQDNLVGNGLTDEESATIFVDSGLFKEYLASVMHKFEARTSLLRAVAEVQVEGLDRFASLWNPAINSDLNERVPVKDWLNFLRGMIGFVLAHEMGHIHAGRQTISPNDEKATLAGPQDKDLRYACWEMQSAKSRSMQQSEAQADSYAGGLLSKILFPNGALRAPLLWYELGAQTYLMYTLNVDMLNAARVTTSNYLKAAMKIQLGSELYSAVVSQNGTQWGALHVIYPQTHPPSIERVRQFLDAVAVSPYSYHHQQPIDYSELVGIKMIIDPACAELQRKYGNH